MQTVFFFSLKRLSTWLRSWWGWRRGSVRDLALELELLGKALALLFLETPFGYRSDAERSNCCCCCCCCCWCCLKRIAAAMACSRMAASSSSLLSRREEERFFVEGCGAGFNFKRAQILPILIVIELNQLMMVLVAHAKEDYEIK